MRHFLLSLLFCIFVFGDARSVRSQEQHTDWFDGKSRTFVVNGYSTSFHWPALLQRKLDRYFDGKRIIEVKSATQGTTPIAKWMNIETGKPRQPWANKLRPLLEDDSRPTIVLAQQSLQWVFGGRSAGIRDEKDSANISKGAAAIKVYADLLKADGAEAVVVAMHIYKKGMEPAIGNERLSLSAFMKTKPSNVFAGPDVWTPTSKVWPQAFQADKVHPNGLGAEVMAHHWFVKLLELSGKDVPLWSEKEMQQAMEKPPQLANSGRRSRREGSRRGGGGMSERMKRHDVNKDGKITKEEFKGPAQLFKRFDRNNDGEITTKDFLGGANGGTRGNRTGQGAPDDVTVLRDVVFGKGGGRDLTMHIVLPKKESSSPMPAYVWVHGGGWQGGKKDGGVGQVVPLVRDGFIGATIEYRLTGEAPFPAQIEDCKCAIRYLRAHAKKYNIDPERIAVGGSSAGGHLVALLGTSGDVDELEGTGGWADQSSSVQAVVDLYGPTDFKAFVTTKGYEGHNRAGSPESKLLGGGEVSSNVAGIKKVNPITYVEKSDPPFLIIHGSNDRTVPLNQSEAMHKALESVKVESTLHVIEGAGHGGPEFANPDVRKMQREFLGNLLMSAEKNSKAKPGKN